MKPIVDSSPDVYEELDRRANADFDVSLLWSRGAGSLIVAVTDTRTGERFELRVAGEDALEVFTHPFAHAEEPGIAWGASGWRLETRR